MKASKIKCVGSVGDVNPLDHGGGYVLTRKGETPWVEYVHEPNEDDTEDDGSARYTLYRVDLELDGAALMASLNWVDFAAVSTSCGYDHDDPWSKLKTPQQRANCIVDIAGYYGWYELDQYPLTLTRKELSKRWRLYK